LGNFNNSTYTANGVTNTFYKKDGKFIINTQGNDGQNHDFEVKYAFGYFPLQQYLIEFPNGKMQATRVSWDSRQHKWFHQYPNEKIPPHDWLHWTGNAQNWNTMCASCHSTNLQKNYNVEQDKYNTTFHEINVGCESCHGAGKLHLDYINNDYKRGKKIEGSLIKIALGTPQMEQINNCAPCHARTASINAEAFNASTNTSELLDHFIPEIPSTEAFYADGQANDEDYTYTSFAESKMFNRGVKCSNCHNPHSGKLVLIGNAVCMQCHAKTYDEPTHTFHATTSEGSQCKNCHMPTKTYMGNDLRYDHTFRVPRPDLSVKYNTPNACNNCHTNKSARWAANAVTKWYGSSRKYHFAEDLILGSLNNDAAEPHLLKLLNDTSTPNIIQATAVHYLKNHVTETSAKALTKSLSHPNAMVRYHALQSLEEFPENVWINSASSLLSDKVKAVRVNAASLYSKIPQEKIPSTLFSSFSNAKNELQQYLFYQTDFSIGNVMLGDYFLKQKDYYNAEKFYLRSLQKDTSLNYVRLNLSTVYAATGKSKEALNILLEAQKIEPKNERTHYNLALLYVELNQPKEAEQCFTKAIKLKSQNPKVYYNFGLLLQQNGNIAKATTVLQKGLTLYPYDADINYALALLYLNTKQMQKAIAPATILKNNDPNNPDYQPLFNALHL
jgi:tetratricopeptide (TPR) repeat protein